MSRKVNKQKAIELILVELDKGTTYTECLDLIGPKWSLSSTTFKRYWKEANTLHSARIQEVQSELKEERVEIEKERLKADLKTKNERVMILQSQIDDIITELEDGYCYDVNGRGKPYKRHLLPSEKTGMRKSIKDLQSEISKIEGDYAALKQDLNVNGSISPENWLKLQGGK
ncbi:MAG TPA: hypothetical protein DEF78_04485 [Sphingobacterium sp.]|nr:hypothetical protein [Sphingobacterium sp.]